MEFESKGIGKIKFFVFAAVFVVVVPAAAAHRGQDAHGGAERKNQAAPDQPGEVAFSCGRHGIPLSLSGYRGVLSAPVLQNIEKVGASASCACSDGAAGGIRTHVGLLPN